MHYEWPIIDLCCQTCTLCKIIKHFGCLDNLLAKRIFDISFHSVIQKRVLSVSQSGVKDKSVLQGVGPHQANNS